MTGQMLLVEDLMLLILDDRKGTAAGYNAVQYMLGGGLLVELAMLERVTQEGEKTLLSRPYIVATGEGPLPDPLLQQAWDTIAEKPRGAQSMLARIGKGLHKTVAARLVDRGLVREEKRQWLGVFPQTTHPAADPAREAAVRREIRAVLADGAQPDPRTAALIALLSAGGVLKASLRDMDPPLRWSGDIRRRGKEIQDGDWGAQAVSDAVKAAAAAIAASTAAVSAAAAVSG
ncbi:GPP34 family phosphoprotein [Kineosporia sp. J2-2]|uniref:GPP34 family phosphoprotein n=1 Tax=Kineosporia corallincola TaxID=2835133 RepID=A0ABS5TGQ8_9ACTN|nr:GPP34 family phosphoprotein [Kineosporia corallincola]MBT0768789.1 GPP34 family phosphoprotein [Kineosporia corallincola]